MIPLFDTILLGGHMILDSVRFRELREEYNLLTNRDNDNMSKRKELEQKYATVETEMSSLRNDLRLALQRIADLQQALEEGDEDDDVDESSDRFVTTL